MNKQASISRDIAIMYGEQFNKYFLYAINLSSGQQKDKIVDQFFNKKKISAFWVFWVAATLKKMLPPKGAELKSMEVAFKHGLSPEFLDMPLWIFKGTLKRSVPIQELEISQKSRLDKKQYCHDFLNLQDCVEIAEALDDRKVSRLTLTVYDAIKLQEQLNIPILISNHSILETNDSVIGNFSNVGNVGVKLKYLDCENLKNAFVNVFISSNWAEALLCATLDVTNRAGHLLGIPKCCREWFRDNWSKALEKCDGDLAFFLIRNQFPKQSIEVCTLTNPFSVYFGGSLISHFPCAIDCEMTKKLALRRKLFLHCSFPNLLEQINRRQYDEFWISKKRDVVTKKPSDEFRWLKISVVR